MINRAIIDDGKISHNPSLGVFTVVGTTGNPHAVRLFPSVTCTCPSTSSCYHVLAVKLSVGLEDSEAKRKINLTQLRRNVQSRVEKKSGRKAPRPGDYDIKPAPDACVSVLPPFVYISTIIIIIQDQCVEDLVEVTSHSVSYQ